jgi:ATP-dependent Clp protease ATP-binding subunit ClpC
MVFERMSEDCIGAIVTAQKESYKLGLEQVEPPVLLAGICDRPERTKPTLERYQITWRKTTQALSQLYPRVTDDTVSLSKFFQQTKQDLPFSKPLRECMVQAGQIANQMGSTTIHSQHAFLALLNMKEPTDSSVTVMQVLHKIMLDPSLTSDDIYKTLLQDLQQADEKELLVAAGKESGTGSSSSTPTLEEVGTDLTLLAQQGRLDVVQGRDEEIKSCLRTLVRRRKNNPGDFYDCCLIINTAKVQVY